MALSGAARIEPVARDVAQAAVRVVELADERGFAPSLEQVGRWLNGGEAPVADVRAALVADARVTVRGDAVALAGREALLDVAAERRDSHAEAAARFEALAAEYADDLVRRAPWVRAVAVCGSLGSGGFAPGDDVDINIFSDRGTKYVTYLTAVLLGIRYAVRHRALAAGVVPGGAPVLPTPFVKKLICINVVWPDEQTRPFARTDDQMAFELLSSRPLLGSDHYARVLAANPALTARYPQLARAVRHPGERARPPPSVRGRFLGWALRRRGLAAVVERTARLCSWLVYHAVQLSRRGDPQARARVSFIRRVKHPYDVFQED